MTAKAGEDGYMLVGVVVLVVLVLIGLSVAVPVVAKDLRRQKELESEARAQQYVRAIRLFYRKTHSYPASIDALKQTSNVRFLRQEYIDPLTGKADWRLIHQGEQKTTVKGFFGQELGGLATGGLGSAAGLASGVGTAVGGTSSTSTVSGASALASGFEGASTTTTTGSTGAFGSTGSTGSSGSGAGGVIVGVGTAATGSSILTPNKQTTYETWEFWYDPRIEQLYQKGKSNGGVGSNGLGAATGATSGFGSGSGLGSASGLSSGFGSSSSSSTGGSTGSTGPTGSTGVTAPNSNF